MSYRFSPICIDLDRLALVYRMPQRILFFFGSSFGFPSIINFFHRDLLMMGAWAIALQSFKGDLLPVCTLKAYLFVNKLTHSPASLTTLLATTVYTKILLTG